MYRNMYKHFINNKQNKILFCLLENTDTQTNVNRYDGVWQGLRGVKLER